MSNTIGNDLAFARPAFYHPECGFSHSDDGCSKREYFAAMAFQGMLANSILIVDCKTKDIATHAVYAADELINALNETK